MFQAIYVILRDAGRSPAEVAGLDLDCLEFDQGEYQLVWHNMKGRRLRRRLPVVRETAEAVMDWKEARAGLDLPRTAPTTCSPAVTGSYQHLDSGYISRAIRLWAHSIPVLESGEPGRDGHRCRSTGRRSSPTRSGTPSASATRTPGSRSTSCRPSWPVRAEIAGLTSERDAALDEIAGLRAALRQMTRRQNTALS
jgi:integrase